MLRGKCGIDNQVLHFFQNGDLCISILHPPVDDPQSGELPCERWNPTQNVRTILLSVISLLNEPNTFSPANVDASVMYRRWRVAMDKDKEYENIIRKQVAASRLEADRDNVVVPITLEDYCIKTKVKPPENSVDMTDFYDDDYDLDDDEDSDMEDDDDGGLDSGGCADDGSVSGGAGMANAEGSKGVVSGSRTAVEGSYEDGDDSGNGET
ncbi:hypothetical protein J437_LFUL011530 [Ladona fulva]|uniref:UBC core domain-containing protein n=1 Tax=Ladona fulva TaxID=123851 RepID=A0A8K0K9X4_LADFU|nr:hypothetical protein J437_LFUL011530 [Ladona fulva]